MSDLPDGFVLDAPAASAPASVPGLPPGFTLDAPAPVTAGGLANAGAGGFARGAIGLAGMGGDLRDAAQGLTQRALGAVGVGDNPNVQRALDVYYKGLSPLLKAANPLLGTAATSGPTSGDITQKIEGMTGQQLPEAKNAPERVLQTVSEFVPGLIAGEGGAVSRIAKQVVIPGLSSAAAGEATRGTAAEPYARLAAALGSTAAAGEIAGSRAASAAAARATPTIEQAKNSATAGFQAPEVAAVTFKPNAIEDVSNIVKSDLGRARLNDRLAPQTHAILEDMKTPVNGAAHTIEDVQTSRTLLGDLAGNFNNPVEQKAATQAIKTLDKLMETMPQSRVATGNIADANSALTDARGNYASAKTAERVQEKLNNADLRAASTYSGGNLNNATRQNLRGLLTSKKGQRGLNPDELQSIEDTVRGSTAGNMLRAGGKLLGGGGGLGMLGAGAAGHALAGPLGLIAPVVGFGAKKAGDAITRANSSKIVNQILARSPLGQQNAAALPVTPAQRLNLLKALLLSNAATVPSRVPVGQFQQ